VLERLGGIESVATLLAEDYVIGRMFKQAGYEVRLCAGVIRNMCVKTSVTGFWHRHVRWGLIRSRMKPFGYPFEILANPMVVALGATIFGVHAWWPLLWGLGLTLARDIFCWMRLRGTSGLARALFWGPIKELMIMGVWIVAPFVRHVAWRGRKYRVSAGTRLYADAPMPPSSVSESVR
ncbi:MAG: glycosyltransferase, partial [Pseudomonadota bacterium]